MHGMLGGRVAGARYAFELLEALEPGGIRRGEPGRLFGHAGIRRGRPVAAVLPVSRPPCSLVGDGGDPFASAERQIGRGLGFQVAQRRLVRHGARQGLAVGDGEQPVSWAAE